MKSFKRRVVPVLAGLLACLWLASPVIADDAYPHIYQTQAFLERVSLNTIGFSPGVHLIFHVTVVPLPFDPSNIPDGFFSHTQVTVDTLPISATLGTPDVMPLTHAYWTYPYDLEMPNCDYFGYHFITEGSTLVLPIPSLTVTAVNDSWETYGMTNQIAAPVIGFLDNPAIGSGETPHVQWDPASIDQNPQNVNQFRVFVLESGTGVRNILHFSDPLAGAADGYDLPEGIVEYGGAYGVAVMAEDTMLKEVGDNWVEAPWSRSGTYVAYTPYEPVAGVTDPVVMPLVEEDVDPSDDAGASMQYHINVAEGEITYLAASALLGVAFRQDESGPRFRSIVVTGSGGEACDLYFQVNGSWVHQAALTAGTEFFFDYPGVDVFGIMKAAGTGPTTGEGGPDSIIGLSFMAAGRFDGTLTPVVPFAGDFNADGDVDGRDAATLAAGAGDVSVSVFAGNFGGLSFL